jgi:hypothetical protein
MKNTEKQKVFLRLIRYFSGDIKNNGLATHAIQQGEKKLRSKVTGC